MEIETIVDELMEKIFQGIQHLIYKEQKEELDDGSNLIIVHTHVKIIQLSSNNI